MDKYSKSQEIFKAWMKENSFHGDFGECLWQAEVGELCLLECWKVYETNMPTIFQIWPDGNGFNIWNMYQRKR